MNSKLIQNTVTLSLPNFPILSVSKHRRVFSKHFTNLALWLPSAELELLNFLVYETQADNTFEYNTFLLKRFAAAYLNARKEYGCPYRVLKNLTNSRATMKSLIERGLILQTGKKNILMVSPMLTYNSDIINNKKYKEIQVLYQVTSPQNLQDFTNYFRNLVSSYLESKKPNYKYGRKKT